MTTQHTANDDTTGLDHSTGTNLLDAIHSNQNAVVDVAEQWVDSVGEALPELWERPIASGAPAIHQIANAAFELTRGILDAQRDFARRIIDSVVVEAKKLD